MKLDIENNDIIIINVSDNDIDKINKIIKEGNKKYKKELTDLQKLEFENIKRYNFIKNKNITIKQINFVTKVIKFVLEEYKNELKQLEVVFLACSYGRQTNKIESDLDLHFIYKSNNYDFRYEEIVCYIITKILNKNRDEIDPKLIINFNKTLKRKHELIMTNNDLEIIIKSNNKKIKYNYLNNKKKKFFLQYNSKKTIKELMKYILKNGIINNNYPWAHSYEVVYGNDVFEKSYLKLCKKERKLLNENYIRKQLVLLKTDLNKIYLNKNELNIAQIKKNYQTEVFSAYYKYLNLIRLYYISKGNSMNYLKIYDLYDSVDNIYKSVIDNILKYIWQIKKISIYCNLNNIEYSLHKNTTIIYNLDKLNKLFLLNKKIILKSIIDMEMTNSE